jgi:hypothetical protein
MKAFFAACHDTIKAHRIAAMQPHALKQLDNGKLRLTGIKAMFLQTRNQA